MSLRFATRLLLFFFLLFGGLYYAKGFLIPIAFAGVLAMLLLPLTGWFERKGAGKSLATAASVLTFVVAVAGLFTLLGWQVKGLLSDMGNIEQKVAQSVSGAQGLLTEKLGIESSSGGTAESSESGKEESGAASGSPADAAALSAAGHDSAGGARASPQTSLTSDSGSKAMTVGAVDSSRTNTASTQSNSGSAPQKAGSQKASGGEGADLKKSFSSGGGGISKAVETLPAAILAFLTDLLITLVYLFLFLRFRLHLKRFVLKIVPEPDRRTALDIIHQSSGVTQRYLTGMGLMILCLWVMYGIGFSVAGVQSAFFFAVLCGTLELVPFVGNLIGTALTILISLTQSEGGGSSVVLGILVTYFIVQTIQSYLLEPLVVGSQVKLHPLFTILIIVLGETVWGIPGMVLAIPLLGITKIIFDRVPALQPYGYLIGEEENANDPSWKSRLRARLSWVFRRG